MKIGLAKRTPDEYDPALLFGGIMLAVVLAVRILPVAPLLPSCIWHGLTGLPCPTCGSTRSLLCLSHGEIAASLSFNPLASIVVLSLILVFFAGMSSRVLFARRLTVECSCREKERLRSAAIAVVLINWAYLVLAGI